MKNSDLIVILGASDNPARPSNITDKLLKKQGFQTIGIPYNNAELDEVGTHGIENKNKTITIFLNPKQQKRYYSYMLSLKPSQIIFNPGTENEELRELAVQNNIKVLSGCTIALIMNSVL